MRETDYTNESIGVTADKNPNREVSDQRTKATAQVWTLDMAITRG